MSGPQRCSAAVTDSQNVLPSIPPAIAASLQRRKIPKLDALRAISAAIVVIYHFGFAFFPAGLGVMIFFVISGFLITWLLLEEFSKSGGIALGRFYFRRTFRIFPAFYVFWLITLAGLLVKHGHILWGQVAATFFYVGNYYQGLNHYPENGFSHAWSLGVEEQYYLLWPALFLLLIRKQPLVLLRASCAGILLIWIYRALLNGVGVPEYYIYTAFETRLDHLLVGCVLAISLRFGYFTGLYRALCARAVYALAVAGGLLLSTTAAWFWGTRYRNSLGFMIDPLLAAALIAQLLATRSRWLGWMDSRPVVYLGTISYSTYLYHKMALGLVAKLAPGGAVVLRLVGGLLATYALASLSYYFVEKPFLRTRDRIQTRWLVRKTVPSLV
jgi:peptidoglycan/LPS O-acetylase OafA/YrhL